MSECFGCSPTPQTINVKREKMIQQIVARCNRSEHRAYGTCCGKGISRSFGRGSDDIAVTLLCRFAQGLVIMLQTSRNRDRSGQSKMHSSFGLATLGLR